MNHKVQLGRRGSVAIAAVSVLLFTLGGCTTARIPVTGIEVPLLDIPLPAILRGQNDLRSRTWTKAFQILHERIGREYAYTDRKGIDWDGLYTAIAPEVAAAEAEKDRDRWYRALRSYVHSIPDGNVQIDANEDLRLADEGASVGLSLAQLEDGSILVSGLVPGGPAEGAGMAWGATLLTWDDRPIGEALDQTSLIWADAPAATPWMRREQQLMWLPRAGEGEACRVTYQNPGAAGPGSATLECVADDYESLLLYRPLWEPVELFSSPVSHKDLAGGLRYVRLAAIAPTLSTPFPVRDFRSAIRAAIDANVPGLVLDLRGTQGGDASLVSKFLSSFVTEPAFYELPGVWNDDESVFQVKEDKTEMVEPQLPAYEGPVVVLVDGYTMGPAESIARFLQGRENVRVCGFSGTYGSPGTPTVELTLPGGYMIYYPARQSLGEDGQPLGVTDHDGNGNVQPDERLPLDQASALAVYQDHEDVVLEHAIALLSGK